VDETLRETINEQLIKAGEKLHAASAVLSAEGVAVESHSGLKTMFGLRLIKTGKIDKRYAKVLGRLKDERENGDYDIFTSFDSEEGKRDVEDAESFISGIKEYLEKEYGIK